jgi:zinc metallohydrolase, glyoxalase II family
MTQEPFPGIFVVEAETEMVGVRHLNYGILRGKPGERSVLIDCGFPAGLDPSGAETLRRAFQELRLSPAELDVLITHGHKDHLGQAQELVRLGARIFVNPEDMDQSAILNTLLMGDEGRRMLFRLVGLETYDRETYEAFWSAADGFVEGYRNIWDFPYTPIHPGESRTVGDYCLEVAALPGHTRGELGFFDRKHKFIFSGDHVLEEVAPIVSNIGEFPNALSAYLRTLREAAERFSDYLFVPGHGAPFRNPEAAVRKAERYYRKHCNQLEKIVRDEGRPVLLRDVGSMAYRRYRRPLTMKEREVCIQIWFKTYACLKYLEEQGRLREELRDGASYWSACA